MRESGVAMSRRS